MRIKELRKKKGKTQEEMATELGIKKQNLQNYEIGKREPSIDILLTLAEYFDCSIDELVGNEKKTSFDASPEKAELLKNIENLTEIECHKLNIFAQGLITNRVAEQKQRTNNLITVINRED